MVNRPNHSRYIVKSLVHASEVLAAFRSEGEVLRLRDVVARTGFNKGMCFRLLYTLHSCGFLEKVGENQYRTVSEIRPNRKSNPADLVTSCARLAKNLFAVSWIARGSQGGSKSFRHPFTSFWFSRDEFQRALANGRLVTLEKSQALKSTQGRRRNALLFQRIQYQPKS